MEKKQPESAVTVFKSAVLAAATEAVVKEMTPEGMRACAEQIIGDALSDLTSAQYGGLRLEVKRVAEEILKERLKVPEIVALIRQAVEVGITDALQVLSAEARGRVIDVALKSMSDGIASAGRR